MLQFFHRHQSMAQPGRGGYKALSIILWRKKYFCITELQLLAGFCAVRNAFSYFVTHATHFLDKKVHFVRIWMLAKKGSKYEIWRICLLFKPGRKEAKLTLLLRGIVAPFWAYIQVEHLNFEYYLSLWSREIKGRFCLQHHLYLPLDPTTC